MDKKDDLEANGSNLVLEVQSSPIQICILPNVSSS